MRQRLSLLVTLLIPLALAACGGGPRMGGGEYGRVYTAPGPAEDPWGPYITEASARFRVPQTWVRAVMRQESGGHAYRNGRPIISAAGAMGLMQLMPATYAMLRDRYELGPDPYDPHDNILAGTGYIAELYARYGSPAFLAAYDTGPHRLDLYLAGQASLPNETIDYIAAVGPVLGGPVSGPLAAYAYGGARAPVRMYAARARRMAPASAPVEVAEAGPTSAGTTLWHDAPEPARPSAPEPAPVYVPPPRHAPSFALIPSAQADALPITAGGAGWGVQVGAFADPAQARQVAEAARGVAPVELASAHAVLGRAVHPDGAVLFRARLVGITHPAADTACDHLSAKRWPCLTVPPGG